MKNQPNLLMTLSTPCSAPLTHTGLSFPKVHFEHLHCSSVQNPPDDTSALNRPRSPSLGSLLIFFFFNVNNKTIWYPFRERTDGALVRRVSHCISLDFAALGCVLPDYCCPAVSHSRKHLWHGTWLQGFWEKPVFLSVFAVWRDSSSHKSPSFLPSHGWMDSELLQNCQEYKAYKINHKAKWICIGFNG